MNTTTHLFCPACGHQIPADAGFCRECGHDLTARTQLAPHGDGEVEGPSSACPHCNAPLRDGAQFCGSCGDAVTVDDPPMQPASLVPTLTPEPRVASRPTRAADAPAPGRRSNGRTAAIIGAAVLLVGGGVAAALSLTGGSSSPATRAAHLDARPQATPEPTVALDATPEPTVALDATPEPIVATPIPEATVDPGQQEQPADPALTDQVQTLDGLMQLSQQGRAAAVRGDTAAAIANRSQLLGELRGLRAAATDAQLQAALDRFISAIRESLRQNRECGSACSANDLRYVARLKQQAMTKLNPLLNKYVGTTYRAEDI